MEIRRAALLVYVMARHEGQVVKETALPYAHHLLTVAATAGDSAPLGFEVGLCHDLLEKTMVTSAELQEALDASGYTLPERMTIVNGVLELTGQFSKANFPALKKKQRKAKEAERLLHISPLAQTVKYADLLYNADWMLRYDPKRAADYLKRKLALIKKMDKGAPELRASVLHHLKGWLQLAGE